MLARLALLAIALLPTPLYAQLRWQEGRHYQTIAQPTPAGEAKGKIEVTEVFSYGCIHCFRAKESIARLAASLPEDAAMTYVHASFLPSEAWPMFQRAWYTARSLGIADALHEQMFTAVWESGEIPLLDLATGRIRNPLPTIEHAAKFYARLSPAKADRFLAVARSAEIDAQMKRADELIKTWKVPGTPALVVNGRYLIDNSALSSAEEQRQLVLYLVGLERKRLQASSPPKP